jgi:hypothetical protein
VPTTEAAANYIREKILPRSPNTLDVISGEESEVERQLGNETQPEWGFDLNT